MDDALIQLYSGHNYFSFSELAPGDNYAGITPHYESLKFRKRVFYNWIIPYF